MQRKKCSNRTVFLIRNVAPGDFGGGEQYQIELGKILRENGFRPIILSASKKLLDEAGKNKIECVRAPFLKQQNWSGWRNALLLVYILWQLWIKRWYGMMIKKYNPCVLNIQSRDEMIGATLAGIRCGKRVIWTDHADFRNWVLWNANVWYKNLIGKKIISLSGKVERVIFVSERIKQETDEMIYPKVIKNSVVIRNGVEDEKRHYSGLVTKRDSFVFVGRVVEEKGVRELVEAFKKVVAKRPSAKLNIYGDGEIERYRKMCDGLSSVVFHGRTEEPLRALAENEIFVLPSYREGLSLSLLDAAMMGKKIIASDVDGNLEVVEDGETGLVMPARNIDKLAEVMIWMLEHDVAAERMAQNARQKYEREFNFEKIFKEKMLPLYESATM